MYINVEDNNGNIELINLDKVMRITEFIGIGDEEPANAIIWFDLMEAPGRQLRIYVKESRHRIIDMMMNNTQFG